MTTATDLMNQIERDYVVPISRPEYDVLAGSYSAVSTTGNVLLTVSETLMPGSILEVNNEIMYVLTYNPNTRTALVKRAHFGTTAAAGSSGDLVRINPRFSMVSIFDAIKDEALSWDTRLFVVQRESMSFTQFQINHTATPTRAPIRALGMRKRPQYSITTFDYVRTDVPFRFSATEDTTDQFTTGYAVHLRQAFDIATTVDVYYGLPFDFSALTVSSNLESTHGLGSGMLEILKWGALARLMSGRETVRGDVTTHTRPDVQANVPAGINAQVGSQYMRMRDQLYDKEYRKLLALWPIRFYG